MISKLKPSVDGSKYADVNPGKGRLLHPSHVGMEINGIDLLLVYIMVHAVGTLR